MDTAYQSDESAVRQLFEAFLANGLHGRFEEALELIDEPYIGAGMGEQGIVQNKEQAALVLQGGYRPPEETSVTYTIKNLIVNFLNNDAAVALGEISITNTPKNGKPIQSGLIQTVGAKRTAERWSIAFTHASPTVLTIESIEAYPIRFMDNTISLLKAGLQAQTVLYAEINLTQNTVSKFECKMQHRGEKKEVHTFEEAVSCALYGELDTAVLKEYNYFWNRLRLLGLFAEGVMEDHFDYHMHTEQGTVWLRAAVEMVRQTYSGDVIAVLSFSSLDNQHLEQIEYKAFHDTLTGILNREGFENRVSEILHEYDPKNNTVLFMLDLDNFKQINDRLGHQTGDTVLRQVAEVLHNTFRTDDAAGRMGGDEFMVLISGDFSLEFIEKKAEELLSSMKLQLGGDKQVPVSVSIGIAYGRGRTTFEKLYRTADIALYSAKKAGKCRYHMINTDTNAEFSYNGSPSAFLSLQTLLEYTDGKELALSKTPYEALLENIPGGVVVLEITPTEIKLTNCNDWLTKQLGLSAEEIAARQAEDPFVFVHPDDIPLLADTVKRVRSGLDNFSINYRIQHKSGQYRHIVMTASITERRQDSAILYGIDIDVDETIRLKQQVETAHNNLEKLLASIPGGVLIISLTDQLHLKHCNDYVARYLGYGIQELAEIEKRNPLSLVHPDDLPHIEKAVKKMRAGTNEINIIYRLLAKDGRYRHVRINATMINRKPGEDTYYGVITDIEEMTAIQQELEYSRKKLEALISAVPGGLAVFQITDTFKVIHYGSWIYKFSGYSSDEEIEQARRGIHLSTIWPEDVPKAKAALLGIRNAIEDSFFLSVRLKCKDGMPKRIDIRGSVIERTPDRVTMYVIFTEPAEEV